MIVFTSICANYLHKARTLPDSVKKHMPDAKFIVCLVEREVKEVKEEFLEFSVIFKDSLLWGGVDA